MPPLRAPGRADVPRGMQATHALGLLARRSVLGHGVLRSKVDPGPGRAADPDRAGQEGGPALGLISIVHHDTFLGQGGEGGRRRPGRAGPGGPGLDDPDRRRERPLAVHPHLRRGWPSWASPTSASPPSARSSGRSGCGRGPPRARAAGTGSSGPTPRRCGPATTSQAGPYGVGPALGARTRACTATTGVAEGVPLVAGDHLVLAGLEIHDNDTKPGRVLVVGARHGSGPSSVGSEPAPRAVFFGRKHLDHLVAEYLGTTTAAPPWDREPHPIPQVPGRRGVGAVLPPEGSGACSVMAAGGISRAPISTHSRPWHPPPPPPTRRPGQAPGRRAKAFPLPLGFAALAPPLARGAALALVGASPAFFPPFATEGVGRAWRAWRASAALARSAALALSSAATFRMVAERPLAVAATARSLAVMPSGAAAARRASRSSLVTIWPGRRPRPP